MKDMPLVGHARDEQMHNLVEFWNTVLPTVTLAVIVGLAWKASAYCTNVDNKLKQLRAAVIKLEKALFKESFTETLSPIALNETGHAISEEINAAEIAERLVRNVPVTDDMDAYQIQTTCFDYARQQLFEELEDGELKLLRQVAFERGHEVKSYGTIFGIMLRDRWLAKLGKAQYEVDFHDPDLPQTA